MTIFRDRNFEQSATSAQRVLSEHQRPPFGGHFIQRKASPIFGPIEELARMSEDTQGSNWF